MEMQLNRDFVLNAVYNQYIQTASDVEETNPDKYAWMCGWIDKHNQYKRFELLLAKVKKKDSILDIGCGTGDMVQYLSEHNMPVKYKGIDVNENYLQIAKKRYPNGDFQHSNGWGLPPNNYDWAVASGIFTIVTNTTYLLWYVGFIMEKLVNKGFAFNLLTNNPYEGLINYNPEEMKRQLVERFPDYKIEIVTGYLPDDFTVYVTK
jgi:cyclopropane fatty-acyl-phospholipid synthase-like methyltransferase